MKEMEERKGLNAGDVRIFSHDGELSETVGAAVGYWRNTLAVFGFANGADFDIHVWDRDGFSHMEAGIRVYGKKGFDGIVSRAVAVLDLVKETKRGVFIVDPVTSPWHDDIQGFAEDTAAMLRRDHGYDVFDYMDLGDFERKFFAYEPMMLSEDGRRIARSGKVLLDEGYRTFGLTDQAMVEMLL